jgi:hypothetical protein
LREAEVDGVVIREINRKQAGIGIDILVSRHDGFLLYPIDIGLPWSF